MRHAIALQLIARGEAADEARRRLERELPDAAFAEPDETGIFEAEVEADSREEALDRIWNAVASAGADDRLRFAEHPDVPQHFRHRGPGARP